MLKNLTLNLIQRENKSFWPKGVPRAQTNHLTTQLMMGNPDSKLMNNQFLEEYLIFFKFWLMQRCRLSMLRILVHEAYLGPPPIWAVVCTNTMALILSCLRPMRSVFNDHVKIKSLLAIWQNRTYQHILNISLSFKMMQHFVFSTSETPRSSILSLLLQDLILSNFGDM